MIKGFLAWTGPSTFDAAPLVVLITGPSLNVKTGPMLQSWILRADVSPMDAVRQGRDQSICGDCRWRPDRDGDGRACYVNVAWAPQNVWKTWKAGRYGESTLSQQNVLLAAAPLRLGAYGDPAMVPIYVWRRLLLGATSWTGYTHQWKHCDPAFKDLCMASVDTEQEAREAQALGWRTFRVRGDVSALQANEIVCPASDEAGHRVTCLQCRLCMGTQKAAKSIAIYAHGPRAGFAEAARQERLW